MLLLEQKGLAEVLEQLQEPHSDAAWTAQAAADLAVAEAILGRWVSQQGCTVLL